MEMKDGGFALTVDAIIAMSFILVIAIALSAQRYSDLSESTELAFVNLHYLSEDSLDVLNKQGVLDQIGEYWTSNNSTAANDLARLYLDDIVPQNVGYKLWIYNNTSTTGYTMLAENNRVPEDEAIAQTYALRFLVGYKKGAPVLSSVSRAFLTGIESKTSSAYAYFGGFEGQGNLTKYIYVPDDADITDAYMELDAGGDFDLTIENTSCGHYPASNVSMSVDVIADPLPCVSAFHPGKNAIYLDFTSGDLVEHFIGGGFISVTYTTTALNESALTGSGRFEFPGIAGLMNYYGSFYVPGTITSMSTHLAFQNNYTTFFRVGDETIFTSAGDPVLQTVDLDDAYLQARLNYNDISGRTIPLRLGTSNISSVIQEGNADVVLITDLSGSMNWRLDNDNTGTQRSCADPNLYTSSTKRVNLAKCLDKQFANIILNNSGNNVALVGFNSDADDAAYNLDFSPSNTTVINKIDSYPNSTSGGTCICCAINKAYEMLAGQEVVIDDGAQWKYKSYSSSTYDLISDGDDNWKYYSYSSCSDSCNPSTTPGSCTPTNWQTYSFNDAPWGTANLPKDSSNEQNNVFYYRKHFTVSLTGFSSATLHLRNRRGVQCYLANSLYPTGYYINTDTSCETGNYWDNTWTISSNRFVVGDNVLACRVRSGSGSSRRGIEFDAELVITNPCGDSCDPSTTPSLCLPTDWHSLEFNDSSWSSVTLPKNNANEEYSVFYYRKHFTLDAAASGSGFLSLRNRRGLQCYINGNLIDTDASCSTGDYWDNEWSFPASYLNDPGEDNVLACRVRAGSDLNNREGIEFDATLTMPSGRHKFVIVMSDGVTGYCCGNDGNCDEEGTDTAGQYSDCDGNQADCTGSQCNGAISNAVWSAERVHLNLLTTLHSVGFGPVSTCANGRYTLEQIAVVGNGSYCASTNPIQLRDCYVQFANEILEASIRSQIINISGSATLSTLYPSSYIDYTYTPNDPDLEYGEITLTYDTPTFNDDVNCDGSFYIPEGVSVIDAKATSYSSEHWTDLASVNGQTVFDLHQQYGTDYFQLGDPYVVYLDVDELDSGQNNTVYVSTGDSTPLQYNSTGCSEDNRAILTIAMSGGVGYGDTFPIAEGCKWDMAFETGPPVVNQPIPWDYDGNATCTYPDPGFSVNNTDAINDAVYRVLQKLDLDGDGLLDILFDPNQVEIDPSRIGGVRSLYGPVQFKLVVWT